MHETWFEYVNIYSKILEAGYELASLSEHGTITGNVREYFVASFLKNILPDAFGIGSGKIIDSHGRKSDQVDIVIYDKSFPALKLSPTEWLFPIESAVASIEVKSSLGNGELEKALNNCKSVTDLSPSVIRNDVTAAQARIGHTHVEWAFPATYIYGYTHYKEQADTLRNAVAAWAHSLPVPEKNNVSLLNFPRIIVSEGCLGLRSSDILPLIPGSGQDPLACAVKKTNFRTHALVCDLFRKILKRVERHNNANGQEFNLESYFDTKKLIQDKIGLIDWMTFPVSIPNNPLLANF